MSRLVARADGNWADASTWAVCDAASELDSEASIATNLTTSDINSQAFVPAAVAIDAILLKIEKREFGALGVPPTNNIIVTLRNSTTATDVVSVTLSLVDLDSTLIADASGDAGDSNNIGWVCFKFGSTHTPNGTDSYLIRVRLSSTSSLVSVFRNTTAGNWSRLLRTTTTAAPVAGDRMIITREWTAVGTGTNRVVTMNNTTTDIYGVNGTASTTAKNFQNAPLSICKGGTLTWSIAGSQALKLRVVGPIVVYNGGSYICGDDSAEMPRTSSAEVEFVMSVSADSRFAAMSGSYVRGIGLSRSVSKDHAWCLLNVDAAAAATTLNVDRDTGWLTGDDIAIASTTRTISQAENRVLNADAGASSMVVTVGLTNAHGGANDVVAEVINMTRNVRMIGTNFQPLFTCYYTANVKFKWASFLTLNSFVFDPKLAGAVVLSYCSFKNLRDYSIKPGATGLAYTVDNCVHWNTVGALSTGFFQGAVGLTSVLTNNVSVRSSSNGSSAVMSIDVNGVGIVSGNRVSGGGYYGIDLTLSSSALGTFDNNVVHSNTNGIRTQFVAKNKVVTGVKVWRCTGIGWFDRSVWINSRIEGAVIFGNASISTDANWTLGECYDLKCDNCIVASDTSASGSVGFDTQVDTGSGLTNGVFKEITFRNCIFGGGGGTKTTFGISDFRFSSATPHTARLVLIDCSLLSSVSVTWSTGIRMGSRFSQQRTNGAMAGTSTVYHQIGTIAYETSVIHVDPVSEKLTPAETLGSTLFSSPRQIRVEATVEYIIEVWVRKTGAYNGSITPRLVVRANPAADVDVDTVLDTMTVGADTWEKLSATVPVSSVEGVLEFAVQINGTAGSLYVADWFYDLG